MSAPEPRVTLLLADLDVGGIQSMVAALARGLRVRGFEVDLACFDRVGAVGDSLAADGFEVELVPRRPGIDRTLGRRIAEHAARRGTRVLHAHNRTALFYGVWAGFAAGASRPRFLYTEHDRSFPETLKVRALHALLARRVDAVAAVCRHVRDAIVSTEGFPAARTRVVRNGAAEPAPVDGTAARLALEAEFPVLRGRPLLLAVGHLSAVKDHATLLEAMAILLRDAPPSARPALLIAGDGELRAPLEERRRALGLDGDVLLPGYRQDVPALLSACNLLVMPSRSEGLSMALVEALGRGVPIVASAVGGNPEVVEDGVVGRLVPPADPPALAAAVAALLGDAPLRARMGEAGRRRFASTFRLDAMVDAYAELYRALQRATSPLR